MGRITYLFGRSVDARQRLLASKTAKKAFDSLIHLVPTRGRVIDLETDPGFWPRKRVNTLTGMISQVFEEDIRYNLFKESRRIDESLRPLLVKKSD